MGDQARWYATSLGVHLGLLSLALSLTVGAVKKTPPVSIDFTLASRTLPEQPRELPRPPVAPSRQPVAAPPPLPVRQAQAQPEPQPLPDVSRNTTAAPTAPTAPAAPATVKTGTEHVPGPLVPNPVAQAVPAPVPRPAPAREEKPAPEKAHQRYLKEHFSYIRDLIMKRLNYPPLARRMEWSGRVVLAFMVAEDGAVQGVQVRESSGYPLLDKSAMDTVRSAAPFPRPPVAAEIVMPVHFRLN